MPDHALILTRRRFLLMVPVLAMSAMAGYSVWRTDETITAFVDTLLPEDELGPAASATGAVEVVQGTFSGSTLRQAELRLLAAWLDFASGGSFAGASPERRHEVVEKLDGLSEDTVRWKIYRRARGAVMLHYFTDAKRAMAMGLPGAPQPDGYPQAHLMNGTH
jgi:hypothetical protein